MNQYDTKSLGILRGIAICMVITNHLYRIPELKVPPGLASFLYWKARNVGWAGVDLFFVLLGFFMAASLFQDLERRGTVDLVSYWKRRLNRIVPSYYLLLLVLACTGASNFVDTKDLGSVLKSISIHVLFVQNYFENPNGPTWFLGVAVSHYIIVPLMMILLVKTVRGRWRRAFPVLAVVIILLTLALRCLWCMIGRHAGEDYYFSHFRTDSIFIGMLSQYILRYCPSITAFIKTRPKTLLVIAMILICPCIEYPRGNVFMFTVGFTFLAMGFALLTMLFALGIVTPIRSNLSAFGAIGDWSYNIYLWHYFLPVLLGSPFAKINLALSSLPLGYLMQIALFFLISIAAGFGVTLCFERPMVRALSRGRATEVLVRSS